MIIKWRNGFVHFSRSWHHPALPFTAGVFWNDLELLTGRRASIGELRYLDYIEVAWWGLRRPDWRLAEWRPITMTRYKADWNFA